MDLKYIIKEINYYRKLDGFSRAIKKGVLSQSFLSCIVNKPVYNKVYSFFIKNRAKKDNPKLLQIENTSFCNARCLMCPHKIMKRKQNTMNLENFKKILDNVMKNYQIKRITLNGFGEPFLDKGIFEKIEYINKRYYKLKIDIYTNASLLTKENSEKLLSKKVDRITFSLNGTKKNYKKIMGLDYEKTEKNVLYFLKKRKEVGNQILCNISLMLLEENQEDVSDFIKFWEPFSDSVRVYPPSDWAGGIKGRNIINKSRIKKKQWPCFALWNNITIDVDGNVIMCCRDYESKVKFGNLLKEDAREIRNSKKFLDLQNKQLNFNFSTPVCSTCDNSSDSSFDWIC